MDTHFQKPAEPWEKTEGSVSSTPLLGRTISISFAHLLYSALCERAFSGCDEVGWGRGGNEYT